MSLLERCAADLWNRGRGWLRRREDRGGLDVGYEVNDDRQSHRHFRLPHDRRPEHIAVLGKTGAGKSALLQHFAQQDIRSDRGFVFFDLHGDTTPALLKLIADEERVRGVDLSRRTILIDPSDAGFAVGIDFMLPHSAVNAPRRYAEVAGIVTVLKHRWELGSLGARTEELLRNALLVVMDRGLTLLELEPVLTDDTFRAGLLSLCQIREAVAYFRERYDVLSTAQAWVYRDAVLNKVSTFTHDPHIRHLVGQEPPTVSLQAIIDRGHWLIVSLPKGRLGAEAHTLGALLLQRLKAVLFARRSRGVFSIYADELQQLLTYDAGLDELLSEARKFGISVVSANQYLDQYPPGMRKAVLATGTQVYFQLSRPDARAIGTLLGGGQPVVERLATLRTQELLVQAPDLPLQHVRVPNRVAPDVSTADLMLRIRHRWMRKRAAVEASIQARQARGRERHTLAGWE